MQTIGILGGMGPQATMDYEARLHRVAQQLVPQRFGFGYPPIVVRHCRHAPLLLYDDNTPVLPIQVDPRLLDAATRLGRDVDFITIPCNAAHLFVRDIERASVRPVLNMIELVIAEAKRRGWTRVGVLGMGDPFVYTRPMSERGFACETLPPEAIAALNAQIETVMEGRDDERSASVARGAVNELRSRGVNGVILGCTEIPLLIPDEADGNPDLINPAQLLAEAAVRRSVQV
jgi:aspartate racemase